MHIGCFDSVEAADTAYKKFKSDYLLEVAEKIETNKTDDIRVAHALREIAKGLILAIGTIQ